MTRLGAERQINHQFVQKLKENPKDFDSFINKSTEKHLVIALEKFGRLDDDKSRKALLELLNSPSEKIRLLSLKNLAKLKDVALIPVFVKCGSNDPSTNVRREAIAAIGRLQSPKAISTLIKFLSDKDPKVVMQAIRGLMPFKAQDQVAKALGPLEKHPNELIKENIKNKVILTEGNKSTSRTKPAKKKYGYLNNKIIYGDVQETLKHIPKESIDLTFTSPPYYNARDYSIYQSYAEYLDSMARIFKGVYKATKEGRFFILNTSPVIVPRISRAHSSRRYPIPFDIHPLLIKMGWEFVDDIVWLKPEASVKNRNAGFFQHRKPLGYKPNAVTEMLMVYRKKTDKLIDWNMKQYDSKEVEKSKVREEYETTNVWKIAPAFDKSHSAVFPMELCNRVIKLYSYVGDLVFDPFGGSGTFGLAAANLKRNFILAEKNKGYLERMKQRWQEKGNLFEEEGEGVEFLSQGKFKELKNNGN